MGTSNLCLKSPVRQVDSQTMLVRLVSSKASEMPFKSDAIMAKAWAVPGGMSITGASSGPQVTSNNKPLKNMFNYLHKQKIKGEGCQFEEWMDVFWLHRHLILQLLLFRINLDCLVDCLPRHHAKPPQNPRPSMQHRLVDNFS